LNRHGLFYDRQDHFKPLDGGNRMGNIGRDGDSIVILLGGIQFVPEKPHTYRQANLCILFGKNAVFKQQKRGGSKLVDPL